MKITLEFSNEEEAEPFLAGPKLHNIVMEFDRLMKMVMNDELTQLGSGKPGDAFEPKHIWEEWCFIKARHG